MIVKKHILETLDSLEASYSSAMDTASPQNSVFFSKLAILEYCGWIEDALDKIVRRSVKGKLKTIEFRQMLETSVIESTHGFQYKRHFRPMLTRAIGLSKTEVIEMHLKRTGQFELFISELENVKSKRDDAAHTWIDGATRTYPAPSYIKERLESIFPIVRGIYSQVVRL